MNTKTYAAAAIATAGVVGLAVVPPLFEAEEPITPEPVVEESPAALSVPLAEKPKEVVAPPVDQPLPAPLEEPVTIPIPPAPDYPDNLDGWINEAMDILEANGVGGFTYHDIHRNIIRESSGDPMAINLWDINAINGIPSKGLLQTIDPTFAAYHIPGTVFDPFDPVANIVAACNYAWDRYGGMSNVNGAY